MALCNKMDDKTREKLVERMTADARLVALPTKTTIDDDTCEEILEEIQRLFADDLKTLAELARTARLPKNQQNTLLDTWLPVRAEQIDFLNQLMSGAIDKNITLVDKKLLETDQGPDPVRCRRNRQGDCGLQQDGDRGGQINAETTNILMDEMRKMGLTTA
jgi:hypothetical protein